MDQPSATTTAANIFNNAIVPIDIRKNGQLLGTAEYVAIEVAVSKIVRNVLRMENRNITELAAVHILSIPFLGGAGAPFGQVQGVGNGPSYTQALKDGAKGVPAVLLAQWVFNTAYKGFHLPWFSVKDIAITAGAKALSRPIVLALWPILGSLSARQGFEVIDALVNRQVAASSIRSRGG